MTKLTTIFLLATSVFAQQQSNGRLQFDWDKLAAKATETVDLNLEPSTLDMASKFLQDNPPLKQMIGKLRGVFIKSFTFDKEGEYSEADVNAIRSQLRSPDWTKVLEAREKHETSLIYIKSDGLVIFTAEPKEFTVIQIVGPIDLSTVPALGGALGIPNMNIGPKPKTAPKKKED